MKRLFMQSKIHRAVVTGADLHYVGSITLDPTLMEAAGVLPWEQVQIVDIENGARFETYVIPGKRDTGEVQLNGAAARLVQPGDHVIVMSYAWLEADELESFHPTVVFVDDQNRVAEIKRLSSPLEAWTPEAA
ncbi:MAG: aspartate 1-decarboxylase [Anaerolineales bacterium]|jgi:aspartate 1-decarboxylase